MTQILRGHLTSEHLIHKSRKLRAVVAMACGELHNMGESSRPKGPLETVMARVAMSHLWNRRELAWIKNQNELHPTK
jgi:hypothetical protein